MAKLLKTLFSDRGDLTAPKGSLQWCVAVREEARKSLESEKTTREHVRRWVSALQDNGCFRQLKDRDGNAFLTWELFCAERPPYGFGMTSEEVEALIESKPRTMAAVKSARENQEPSRDGPGAPEGNRNAAKNNGAEKEKRHNCPRGSNQSSTRIRKLRRDCPEAAEKLERGEFKSVAAAERWSKGEDPNPPRKVPTRLERVQRLCKALSKQERRQFLDWASQPGNLD
jgi:hypothetical protein